MQESLKNLREEISIILVKWSMPTRQVAISEILALFEAKLAGKKKSDEAHSQFVADVLDGMKPEDAWRKLQAILDEA